MPSKSTYIAPIGGGLGDLVVSLPALQYLIARAERTVLVSRSPRHDGLAELIPGLAGTVREVDFDATKLGVDDRYINLRDHPMQTEHLWGSPEFDAKFPDYRIADILRDICHDFGIMADFDHLQPLPFEHRPDCEGAVFLVPGSEAAFKCWSAERWSELRDKLQSQGERVFVLGQPERFRSVRRLLEMGLPWLQTPSVRDLLNAISSARAVISIDTGPMHMALQQLIPTVAMFVNQPGSFHYMRTVEHCYPILSAPCRPECVQATFDMKLNEVTEFKQWEHLFAWECPFESEKPCMNGITVDMVLEKTKIALKRGKSTCGSAVVCER